MIQRILCPTDLTENSRDSVAYALRLANENSAQLLVFHVTSFPSVRQLPCELEPYYRWEELVSKFRMDEVVATAARKVYNFIDCTFRTEASRVAWRPRVAVGKISDEIVNAACVEEVDLIVMARCKRAPLARIFTASVAEAVGSGAPCPVLSIDRTPLVGTPHGWRLPLLRDVFQSY
jgi:nucleotide-binding universal stress UspA family protein